MIAPGYAAVRKGSASALPFELWNPYFFEACAPPITWEHLQPQSRPLHPSRGLWGYPPFGLRTVRVVHVTRRFRGWISINIESSAASGFSAKLVDVAQASSKFSLVHAYMYEERAG